MSKTSNEEKLNYRGTVGFAVKVAEHLIDSLQDARKMRDPDSRDVYIESTTMDILRMFVSRTDAHRDAEFNDIEKLVLYLREQAMEILNLTAILSHLAMIESEE